ncbi:MAG: MBL fold metallo-hydrolase [Lentisphaeria bacterium]|jgi:L-ascorbate metabolism protein UlaG (beta-lactamase superfamily)|nr:MBL fold metallo-hydrolase [Lentisphaeria bacterium]
MSTGQTLIAEIDAFSAPSGTVAFWWLGQHSFIAKFGGRVVYFDPYLNPSPKRNTPSLLRPEEVTGADLVLGTHDHSDHIDRPSLPALLAASPQATLVVPDLVREKLVGDLALDKRRIAGLDAGQTVEIAGLRVSAVAAAHEFLDRDPVTGRHPYLGYIVQGHGVTVYHAGDTCIYEGMRAALARFPIDLAFLPINGRDAARYARHCIGNMTYQEAADLAGNIRPRLVVHTHFDMFNGNTENPELFRAYLNVKYPHLATMIPRHGEKNLLAVAPVGS